ncbi:MAG: tetratricopeptide repeat protein [Gammaproteobacteria bacterium]|nr:tetratricopeptide repeat protein [Gammaproteobacteria bacterium]MBU1480867.1 tetratricopeptide repeat protein [Gammaproteobacteria bacterium]
MSIDFSSAQSGLSAEEQAFGRALEHQQAGRLREAETEYRDVLQINPHHAKANHNLGVVSVQMGQPAAGLAHFLAALEAEPTHGQYWLSYIDALYRAGQPDDARQVLQIARQQGLDGEEVEALELLLQSEGQDAEQADGQPGVKQPPAPLSVHGAKKDNNSKSGKPNPKPSSHHGKNPGQKEIDTLVASFNQGRMQEAAALAQTMTERYPQHWIGWKMLGVVFQQMGRHRDALPAMQKTVALSPRDVEAHNNFGIILHNLGNFEEAEASYRRALKINPDYAQALNCLGATLQELKRPDEAEACYCKALRIKPDYARAHGNLGALLHDLGRLDEAAASCRCALQIDPQYTQARNNLGIVLHDMGREKEAADCFRQVLQMDPQFAEAHFNLGNALKNLGKPDEAEASYRKALQIKPDYAEAYCNLGATYQDMSRPEDAETCYRKALEIKPDYAEAHSNLGSTLNSLGRTAEGEASYRKALEYKLDLAEAHSNLGGTLHDAGRLEEAVVSYRRALEIKPDFAQAYSNLLFCLTQSATLDAHALFLEHRRFGEQFETLPPDALAQHVNSRDPERCLQVGFVSGDFRDHAIAYFIEPILACLAGNARLTLHAYYNHVVDDATTRRIKKHFAHWYPVTGMSDVALADKISAEGIDILIDLSGHANNNRLPVFARKPVPVQASWMGYPGTTGLTTMDYYLADRHLLPQGRFDDQFTEKIVQLPASAPFLPSREAPPVSGLPALDNGYITFGSFNRMSKLSPGVIALWSQLLRAMPDARMLLGGMAEDEKYKMLIEWFAQEGIARERLDFHARSGMAEYLALHRQVDICLDTFPYNGSTTTFHALWMGVPTLTLAGNTVAGRPGAQILGHVGLEACIASDAADFVQKGLALAGDTAALSSLRAVLRERLSVSALGKPELIAAGLARALRTMWRRWCAGLPPQAFEVNMQEADETRQEEGK